MGLSFLRAPAWFLVMLLGCSGEQHTQNGHTADASMNAVLPEADAAVEQEASVTGHMPDAHVTPPAADASAQPADAQPHDDAEVDTDGGPTALAPPVITTLIYGAPLRVGSSIEIRGGDFRVSAGGILVMFDDVQVTAFRPGTDDTHLFINVPNLDLPLEGRRAKLTISNGIGKATENLLILPYDFNASEGNLFDVVWTGQTPQTAQPGEVLTLTYDLHSRTGAPTTVDLTPSVSGGGSSWQGAALSVRDAQGEVVADGQVDVAALGTTSFSIQVPVPQGAAGTVRVAVQARARKMYGGDVRFVDLGAASVAPDMTFVLAPGSAFVGGTPGWPESGGGGIDLASQTALLRPGVEGKISMHASFTQPGSYVLEATISAAWQLSSDGVVFGPEQTVSQTIVVNQAPYGSGRDISFRTETASSPGTLTVRLRRVGSDLEQSKVFALYPLP